MALPPFLSWTGHGSSCGEPPGVFTGGTMHLFGLDADAKVMQDLVDRFLTPVAGPNVVYKVLVGQALLTVVDIKQGTTAVEIVGWLPGQECALWIPLLETTVPPLTIPPTLPATRVVMWSPYIFISYAIGMVTGREVWGWSKGLAKIDFPAAGAAAPVFAVSTTIFPVLDKTKPGVDAVLLKITGAGALTTAATWGSIDDAALDIIEKLTGVRPAVSPFLFSPIFPAIALKQFRDSNATGLACYQAIVNSPVKIKNFGGGGFHTAHFDVEIATCESHPIAEKFLGVKPMPGSTAVPAKWAAFVNFDFDALPGTVIAKTT